MSPRRELRCTWIAPAEDRDARLLVPGCMERVQDWDAACTCPTSAEELTALDARIAELEAEMDRVKDCYHALLAVVGRQPDAASLHRQADEIFGEWRRMKADVRQANETEGVPS